LSSEEERHIKRQRRLIKNRESAQLSRLRKKIYIEELERKVNQLQTDNENLTKQVNTVSTDRKKLQEEVTYLQGIIKQSPALSQIAANSTKKQVMGKNVKAAGICLLVVLFSFGLLFNANPGMSLRSPGEERELGSKGKNVYTGRLLKSIKEETKLPELPTKNELVEFPSIDDEMDVEVSSVTDLESKNKKELKDLKQSRKQAIVEDNHVDKVNAVSKKRKMKIADEVEDSTTSLVTFDHTQPKHTTHDPTELVVRHRPNTSYIFCSEAQHISSSSQNENIALLIPASVLNATSDPQFDTSMLEVSCQVLNVQLWPMPNTTRS